MSVTRLTVEQWTALYPQDRQRYLEANDLLGVTPGAQEAQWQQHLEGVQWFFAKLSTIETIVLTQTTPEA